MMHHKALLFNDAVTAAQVLTTKSPKAVRALGRQVPNYSDEVWHAHRSRIVEEANVLKFTTPPVIDAASTKDVPGALRGSGNPDAAPVGDGGLRALLLATGERELVEASPMDKIWGVGFGAERAESERERWGLNLLGKALMSVREKLRAEEAGGAKGKAKGKSETKVEPEAEGEVKGKGKEKKSEAKEEAGGEKVKTWSKVVTGS